jgi:Domain of unknown function (DUF4158)
MGAALQLGFVRMTGTTLDSLEYVPPSLLRHLGRQFVQRAPDLATLRSLYRRTQTRYRHQRWAMQYRGLRELGKRNQELEEYVRERTHATLSRGRLEQLAREWLRRPPRRRSMRTVRELLDKYLWLKQRIGYCCPLPISKERQRVYARRMRRRWADHIPQLPPFRQELEAICFAAVTLATLADDILRLLEMRIAAIWTWAHKVAAEQGPRTACANAARRHRLEIFPVFVTISMPRPNLERVYSSRSVIMRRIDVAHLFAIYSARWRCWSWTRVSPRVLPIPGTSSEQALSSCARMPPLRDDGSNIRFDEMT